MSLNLSKQERKVAHLISNGYLSKEIADVLHISVLTVKAHTRNIREKTGAKNIADITRKYILSLPKPNDVFKVLFFLMIQFSVIMSNPDIDLRRVRRCKRSGVRITRILKN
jgi:DNA-binding CsgD family transcriptional regulator